MRVDEIMSRSVVTVSPDTPLKEVAELLSERGISGVPVTEDGSVVGVVSESDIVLKERAADAERPGPLTRLGRRRWKSVAGAMTARDAMTAPPVTVEPWWSIAGAAWLMAEHDVNRLPVVEHGRLVGVVARADLVRAFARSDADIAREIREEILPSLSLSPNEVTVAVERGVVTLHGELEDQRDLEALPQAVQRVVGVVRVDSGLRARVPEGGVR